VLVLGIVLEYEYDDDFEHEHEHEHPGERKGGSVCDGAVLRATGNSEGEG